VVRGVDRPGALMNKREVVDAVSIIETSSHGSGGSCRIRGNPGRFLTLTTVFAEHLSEEFERQSLQELVQG
jgi:large subunit ribosomal protein L3e